MDAAALVLLVSGVGVGFGWQPMPDGSPRYEYIVQVEPELLATLAGGQSIPISGDVPEHVHPIGRVRLVVGRGALPRQQLVTLLKPVEDGKTAAAGSGVQQAQYAEPALPRYGEPASQPYAAAAQNGGASEWNGAADAASQQTYGALPTGQQPSDPTTGGQGTSWNDGSAIPAMAAAPGAAMARIGDTIQNATAPVREGVDRLNTGVRNAADDLGGRTRQMVDELSRPFTGQNAAAAPDYRQSAAATTAAGSTAATGGSNWNDPAATVGTAPAAQQPAGRYPLGTTAAPPATPPLASQAAQPSGQNAWNEDPALPPAAAGQAPGRGAQPTAEDLWATSPDPRLRGGATATIGGPTVTAQAGNASTPGSRSWPTEGPSLDASGSNGAINPQTPNFWTGAIGTAPPALGVPEIGKSMLAKPANRELEGVDSAQQFADSPFPSLPRDTTTTPASQTAATKAPSDTLNAAAQGWRDDPAAKKTTSGPENVVTVLAAWVLLSGSVAGNLYLFWSYLDVRQKYRALVRKTARAVGSRFSAA